MNRKRAQGRFVFFCIAPAAILVTLFIFIPTINVFRMSLYRMGGITNRKEFVGLSNFQSLFDDKNFLQTMQNSIAIIVLVTLFTIFFAILFGAILHRGKFKGKNFFRVIFYIPNILSIVVIAGIFGAIYNPSTGLLNTFLRAIGLDALAHQWMGDQKIVLYSIIFALVWQAIGYYMVMHVASIDGISQEIYEAASIDGATGAQKFFKITIPLLRRSIGTTYILALSGTINLSFTLSNVMTGGGPNGASSVLLQYMYTQGMRNANFGYAMAIAMFTLMLAIVLAMISRKLSAEKE